jgi:hypothetical protein
MMSPDDKISMLERQLQLIKELLIIHLKGQGLAAEKSVEVLQILPNLVEE